MGGAEVGDKVDQGFILITALEGGQRPVVFK